MQRKMKRGDVLVCEAHSEHCFLNPEGKIIKLKQQYPEFYDTLTGRVNKREY